MREFAPSAVATTPVVGLWASPAASRHMGQLVSFATWPSYLASASVSQLSSSVDPPLAPDDAIFVWHLITAPVSFARSLATPLSHLSVAASGGISPASSPEGSMSTVPAQ